jgi:hypothetical protein
MLVASKNQLIVGERMTRTEIVGIVLGSIGSVAAIIAAWASVAERLEKRRERLALNLSPEEKTIIWIASVQSNLRIECGDYGGDILITPAYESHFMRLPNDSLLHRLESSGFLAKGNTISSKNHGPSMAPGATNYVSVTIYQLTSQGRVRAREIPASLAITTLKRLNNK